MRYAPALLLALCSCGTIGRDDALAERPCNATGPWSDRGSVEVCLGSALAVPTSAPATDVGGLCVADEARPCDDDTDCRATERCRCGLCRVLRCRSSSECLADETCIVALGRCARPCDPAVADACPAGFGCSLGGCVARCGEEADCAHGESCSIRSGRCVVANCTGDGDCGTERRCEVQTIAADVLGPDAFVEGDHALVWAEVAREGRSAIHRFAWPSPTRLVAAPGTPLLEPLATWEEGRVGAPSLLAAGGTVWLFYAGGADAGIGLAAADATGSFVRVSDGPILAPSATWEDGRVGAPAAAVDGEGNVLLLYSGGGGAGIGAARWTSDGTFERLPASPLLLPGVLEAPGR